MTKPKPKPKVIKAEVIKADKPKKKRLSKGAGYPWEVRSVNIGNYHGVANGFYGNIEEFKIKKNAERYIKANSKLVAPVIIHVVIPEVEY